MYKLQPQVFQQINPVLYTKSTPYFHAIRRNLMQIGVDIDVTHIHNDMIFVTIQQVGSLEYIYDHEELKERGLAVCRRLDYIPVVTVLPARKKD